MLKQVIIAAIAFTTFQPAFSQLRTPQPSTTQTIRQDFGIGNIELSYSRPAMRNRKVYGELVPFGKVWRTGANQATTLTFSDSVIIGGTKLAPGKYGLLSIPAKDQWTLIISRQTDVTSPAAYKADQDLARVTVRPMQMKDAVETFTMQFANVKNNSIELHIMWENTAVSLPIATDYDARVMANINRQLNLDNRPYFQAALYYMETGKDLNQALAWLDKSLEQQPNAFWIHHQRANALARLGRKDEARTAAQKSMEMARSQQNDDYVKLNEKLIESLK
jgi:hypothetical protein